jgi:hypothetical protein
VIYYKIYQKEKSDTNGRVITSCLTICGVLVVVAGAAERTCDMDRKKGDRWLCCCCWPSAINNVALRTRSKIQQRLLLNVLE